MSFEHEKKRALGLLQGLEQGSVDTGELATRLEAADPSLLYFILTWLRAHYRASNPAAEGVVGRIVEICNRSPTITRNAKEGAEDSVVEWFEEAYDYRDLDGPTFIDVVVEKLEG